MATRKDSSPIRDNTYGIGQASLLDRLLDREPKVRAEAISSQAQSLRDLKASIRRDLEFLLNSRRPPVDMPEGIQELNHSVYYYGLPDISGLAVSSSKDQKIMVNMIERAIADYEPRLTNVAVSIQPAVGKARVLRFQIEALLMIEPAPERITFDTKLELTSGEYSVEGKDRA
jgi:type VI secretion system protein ImpF